MRYLPLIALLAALPISANAQEINHQTRIGHAVRAGCSVQQVHTPAGKMVHNAPVVRCPDQVAARGQSAQSASNQNLSVSVANVSAR